MAPTSITLHRVVNIDLTEELLNVRSRRYTKRERASLLALYAEFLAGDLVAADARVAKWPRTMHELIDESVWKVLWGRRAVGEIYHVPPSATPDKANAKTILVVRRKRA